MSQEQTQNNDRIESILKYGKEKTDKLTTPMTVLLYFFIITVLYGFITVNSILNSINIDSIYEKTNNMTADIIYICVLLIGTVYMNAKISKTICNTNAVKWGDVFLITIIPWLVVFGLIYFLLEIFPGWIRPFSNTIGYFITNSLGTKDTIIEVIKKAETVKDNSLKRAIININANMTKFINEIEPDKHSFIKFVNQLKTEGFTNSEKGNNIFNEPAVIKLYSLVVSKFVIGKFVWYILAGILIASISYNSIIAISCDKTISEYKTEYDSIYANDKSVVYGNEWQKRNPSEVTGKRNGNDTYANLIRMYADKFNKNTVTLTTDELNRAGVIYEIPNDIYITIRSNNDVYIPTA